MPEQDIIGKTTVEVDNAEALAVLGRLRGALAAREGLHRVAGRAMGNRLRRHFRARNQGVDRKGGWPASNYWNMAAESVEARCDEEGAQVSVRKEGVLWHLRGGTIRPRNSKALAIPLQPGLKDKNPREVWPDRKGAFVWRDPKSDRAFLATGEDGKLTLHYLLLQSVSKAADPAVLPGDAIIEGDMTRAVSGFLRRALNSAAQQTGDPANG
jgi:hypothetical protein